MSCRATALTTPIVTDDESPSGLPKASTICPGRSASESPNGSAGSARAVDLDHREVGLVVDRDDLRADRPAAPFEDRPPGVAAGRRERQLDFDPRRVLDDVRVGDDVAVRRHDHAGAAAPFEHRIAARGPVVLVGQRVAGHEDLDDARADLLGEILKERDRSVSAWGLAVCAAAAAGRPRATRTAASGSTRLDIRRL